MAAEGLELDRADDPAGDRFGCRYEAYLTDPRTERMKTKWQIELAMRLADQAVSRRARRHGSNGGGRPSP